MKVTIIQKSKPQNHLVIKNFQKFVDGCLSNEKTYLIQLPISLFGVEFQTYISREDCEYIISSSEVSSNCISFYLWCALFIFICFYFFLIWFAHVERDCIWLMIIFFWHFDKIIGTCMVNYILPKRNHNFYLLILNITGRFLFTHSTYAFAPFIYMSTNVIL